MNDSPEDALAALPPRRRAFVEAYADPTSPTYLNGTRTAVAAGYSQAAPEVEASRLLRNVEVQRGIESVAAQARAAFRSQGITPEFMALQLQKSMADDDPKVRPSKVRATEIAMKVEGWLGADTEVSIDARSLVLPELPAGILDALISTLSEPDNTSLET